MANIALFYAAGFEEAEGIIPADMLRRAHQEVQTVSITDKREVISSHGFTIMTDLTWKEFDPQSYDVLFVPGGKGGVEQLSAFEPLAPVLQQHFNQGKLTCAICAGPSILGEAGILAGRSYTCYPGWESDAYKGNYQNTTVVHDGNLITGRAMAWSIDLAREIIQTICPNHLAEVDAGIQYK